MDKMEKIVALCKRRGIIFPGSEIYGGLGSTYDYGHWGVLMKNNLKQLWWKDNVINRKDMIGLDAAVLMHSRVWEASGHITSFSDPLVECKSCHQRFRSDHLNDGKYGKTEIKNGKRSCPLCGGELTGEKKFNLMFKSHIGPVEEIASVVYLRPETAQGIFVDYKTMISSYGKKLPFGIAQIGKAFRNEITPGNFTFRMREFEQMEIEFFTNPESSGKWFRYWIDTRLAWYKNYGIKDKSLRLREHTKEELSHYSKGTFDIEFQFPWGWGELEGIANRGDYDLSQHEKYSGKDMHYFDEVHSKKFIPCVIEPSAGADRALLAFITDAYHEDNDRVVLRLHPKIAPVNIAVFPLLKNKPELVSSAKKVYDLLNKYYYTVWDERGNIGKRYYAQDEIGTPFCVTVDFDTLKNDTVTVRDRDSAKQIRKKIADLKEYFDYFFNSVK